MVRDKISHSNINNSFIGGDLFTNVINGGNSKV